MIKKEEKGSSPAGGWSGARPKIQQASKPAKIWQALKTVGWTHQRDRGKSMEKTWPELLVGSKHTNAFNRFERD